MKNAEQTPWYGKPWVGYALTALAGLMSVLLYEAKVSEGGDDSSYVWRAWALVNNGTYPSFQGPIYPMFLAIFVALAGVKVQLLKILSLLAMLFFFASFFTTYKQRVPAPALLITGALLAVNQYLLYFSSQTYSEAFFMMCQILFLGYFFKNFLEAEPEHWKHYLFLGLWIVFLGNVRSVGFASAFAVGAYFLFDKRWKGLGFTVGATALVLLAVEGFKRLVFGAELQVTGQGSSLLLKDPYAPTEGNEDLAGLWERFWGNADLYLSKHFTKFLGINPVDYIETSTLTTYFILALCGVAFFGVWKKNKTLKFTGFYGLMLLLFTFVAVQTRWDQYRLAVPYFPFLLLFMIGGSAEFLKRFNPRLALVPVGVGVILLFAVFKQTSTKVKEHRDELVAAFGGDVLAGYSPDWKNYILMSEYAAKNVPDSVVIGSRKAGISFIYGSREFYGITKIPFAYADSLFADGQHWLMLPKDQADRLLAAQPAYQERVTAFCFGAPKEGNTTVVENVFYTFLLWNSAEEQAEATIVASTLGLTPTGAGRDFLDNFKEVYLVNPDQLLQQLKDNNVGYVIMANLRRNPKVRDGYTINTISRFLYYIQLKYPGALQQIHKIGAAEEATLVKINFPPSIR